MYTQFVNYHLLRYKEEGVLDNLAKRYGHSEEVCSQDEGDRALSFNKVVGLFSLWSFGVIAAIICFAIEKLVTSSSKPTTSIELSPSESIQVQWNAFFLRWGVADRRQFLEELARIVK